MTLAVGQSATDSRCAAAWAASAYDLALMEDGLSLLLMDLSTTIPRIPQPRHSAMWTSRVPTTRLMDLRKPHACVRDHGPGLGSPQDMPDTSSKMSLDMRGIPIA
jgi:hypothetical protein